MELLYGKFYERLYLYARTFLGTDEESKDVVADVFQVLWEEGSSLAPESGMAAYLYTSVRNRCLDVLRHGRTVERYAGFCLATEKIQTDDDVALFEEKVAIVADAVSKLPEPGRSVLRCTYFNNMTYRQTAVQLNMSENMVHKYMTKMFKLLKEMLKNAFV